jgi:type IV pilus assembly protein PilO
MATLPKLSGLSAPKLNIDFAALSASVTDQFRGLNPNDPSKWPVIPRTLLLAGAVILVVVAGWFLWLSGEQGVLSAAEAEEVRLKEDFRKKYAQAVNLETLRRQREQVRQYVLQLEKQLPSKAEMDALLSDINQAGIGRGLQFELFQPGGVAVREYYAELPITVKVTGRYHEIAAFTGDIANLSRIVTLNNLAISTGKDPGTLVLDATAKTFRYLDPEEVASQRKTQPGAKK